MIYWLAALPPNPSANAIPLVFPKPAPAQPFPLRIQFTATALLSSSPLKYRDTRVPTCGIIYIMFPVGGTQFQAYACWLGYPASISKLSLTVSPRQPVTVPKRDIPDIFSLLMRLVLALSWRERI